MEIQEIRVLRGPNYWSVQHKIILIRLDIGKYENLPSNKIPGFTDRLVKLLPGLTEHHCSEGKPGGFVERLRSGTWIGHIVEHIALELQTVAGMPCNYGKTRTTGDAGIYHVAISYSEERAGIYAARAAVELAEAIAKGSDYDIEKDVLNLKQIAADDKPGPSTSSILNAASGRGIPWFKLSDGLLYQLGYGIHARRIDATITENTSNIAVDIACDKQRTRILLNDIAIPVPKGVVTNNRNEAMEMIAKIGYPVVIKPLDSNQGKGVAVNISNPEDAMFYFDEARKYSEQIIIERYHPGNDYRLLVINKKLVAASLRTPAMVTGDGHSTIKELIEVANCNPHRGVEHENILTQIKVDHSTLALLKMQQLTPDSVPRPGQEVILKHTANLSTGGTAEDVTDIVHPQIRMMAERVAMIVGLDICGIDMIAEDISRPLKESKAVVIEVNAAPGFRMHTHPFIGKSRPVGKAVAEMMFPEGNNGRIPIIAITGTNGKTTTSRLLAHMVSTAGYHAGYTTTDGVYINGVRVEEGDCTGFKSTQHVLLDKTVDFAVLECARGGLLKSGLAFDSCDAAIVTNVAADHLGMEGINTIEEMAFVKSVIPETVKPDGYAILNANNDHTYAMKDRVKCKVAFFSINAKNKRIVEHCRNGGLAAVYRNGEVVIIEGEKVHLHETIYNIPMTFDGKAPFMIENVLAAMLGAWVNHISGDHIIESLRTFEPGYENTPGRMNLIKFRNFNLIIDYAHNLHGISALGELVKNTKATSKIGIITAPGDRRELDIRSIGRVCAEIFDRIIIRIDKDTRGRTSGEIISILYNGIKSAKRRNFPVEVIPDESDALTYALSTAVAGSLIVLMSEEIEQSVRIAREFREMNHALDFEKLSGDMYVLRVGKNNTYEYTKRKINTYRR